MDCSASGASARACGRVSAWAGPRLTASHVDQAGAMWRTPGAAQGTMHHDVAGFRLRKPGTERRRSALPHQERSGRRRAPGRLRQPGTPRPTLEAWVEFHRRRQGRSALRHRGPRTTAPSATSGSTSDRSHRIRSAEFAIVIGDKSQWGRESGARARAFAIEYGFDELNLRRVFLEVCSPRTTARSSSIARSASSKRGASARPPAGKHGRYIDACSSWGCWPKSTGAMPPE